MHVHIGCFGTEYLGQCDCGVIHLHGLRDCVRDNLPLMQRDWFGAVIGYNDASASPWIDIQCAVHGNELCLCVQRLVGLYQHRAQSFTNDINKLLGLWWYHHVSE